MIYKGSGAIGGVFKGSRIIGAVYKGSRLVWSGIHSCFGSGVWLDEKPWLNEERWKDNRG